MGSPVPWGVLGPSEVEMGAQALVEVGPGAVVTGLARRWRPACRP